MGDIPKYQYKKSRSKKFQTNVELAPNYDKIYNLIETQNLNNQNQNFLGQNECSYDQNQPYYDRNIKYIYYYSTLNKILNIKVKEITHFPIKPRTEISKKSIK